MSFASLLLPLFLVSPAHAKKDPCKKAITTAEDAFGSTISVGVVYLDRGHWTALGITKKDDTLTLEVLWVRSGVLNESIPIGNTTSLALSSGGEVLEIPSNEASNPISGANTSSIYTQWIVRHGLTADHLVTFASTPPVAIKTQGAGGEWQLVLDEKQSEKFGEIAACMQN